jgi:acyl carrier protein
MSERQQAGQQASKATTDVAARRLVDLIGALSHEIQPGRRDLRVTLDSDLDRDLGFDSLSRVELLLRVERAFDVALPEQVFSAAESPRDLLRAVQGSRRGRATPPADVVQPVAQEATEMVPAETGTLAEVLAWHTRAHPQRPHVHLYLPDHDDPLPITYAALQRGASAVAARLVARGLEPGQTVAIMLPTSQAYLESFMGIVLAGGVPVPIYPPARASQLEDHLTRHAKILANAQAIMLITVPEALRVARVLKRHVESLREVLTPELLTEPGAASEFPVGHGEDVAMLQYTSGSTGQPKGVVLTHSNLLANIRAMGVAIEASPSDVFISWLPLYHDMGLIGAWLGCLYYGIPTVLMSPVAFLTRPWRWLWAIHRHGGTLSSAPNFAYELCLSKIPDSEIEGLDLSSWRVAFNGAEPISPQTLRRFGKRFEPYGFDPRAMAPVYGLAEVAVGLAFPPLGRGPLIDRVQRRDFELRGRATPESIAGVGPLEFVASGQPLTGYEVRIVDPSGRELPEREEGRLEFRGPSTTSGYMRNPAATQALFDGDWLDSGDLAYIAGGDVYITSRVKDVIIRAGRNVYPYELEEAVGDLEGIRKGCVAVFGSADPQAPSERLVVVAETRETDARVSDGLRSNIIALATELLDVAPDEVVLVPPRSVLKTSSGKIRRAACRELYESGRLGRGPRAAWWQYARLSLAGIKPGWRHFRRLAVDLAYATYVYLLFALAVPVSLLGMAILPTLPARWGYLQRCLRLLLRLGRVPLVVEGDDRLLLDRATVFIANHSSYLDGLVLVCALPEPVSFVAKAELARQPLAGWFLRRLNTRFVERFDVEQGLSDAEQLSRAAVRESLLFFPEGTLTRSPGLLPFHLGAFAAAAAAQCPVVPIVVRGTRSMLRSGGWFPRRGTVAVVVGEPIEPAGTDWRAAVALRDEARTQVLKRLGEPDLAMEKPPI